MSHLIATVPRLPVRDTRLVQIERIIDSHEVVIEVVPERAINVLGVATQLPVNEGISAYVHFGARTLVGVGI